MDIAEHIKLLPGDCMDVLATLPDNSTDSCVTDPPYHLTSIVKRFANDKSNLEQPADKDLTRVNAGQYRRLAGGFMGKQWDGGAIAQSVDLWRHVYRVLKPGAHLVAFGGTRTQHRMVCAIEDAGFEIRDTILYLFGSGFPKSHNVGNGFGTALKPACEPIVLARKPLSEKTVAANVLRWGTGAINVDGCRVATDERLLCHRPSTLNKNVYGKYAESYDGKGRQYASGNLGRWPANVIHDGSDEVVNGFPDSKSCDSPSSADCEGTILGGSRTQGAIYPGENGSAARFFYTAKADSDDRIGSKHPTVKPLDLMQYLVRLVTPKGGTVLDMFAGTGTTGEAAFREGMKAVLIEREAEYQADIRRRIDLCMAGPVERQHASIKAKLEGKPRDDGPLFGGTDWDSMWQKPFDKPELL